MDENSYNNKVLGLQSSTFVKTAYVLVLISAGLGLLFAIISGIGLGAPTGGGVVTLVGLAGWIMALVGWLAFQKDFTVIELSHLRFISVLFVALYVLGIIVALLLGVGGLIWGVCSLALSVLCFGMLYLGFSLWRSREEVTQEALKGEFQLLKSRFTNRSDV
jgi:hypothetical protein